MDTIKDLTPYLDPELANGLQTLPHVDIESDLNGFRNLRKMDAMPAPDGVNIENITINRDHPVRARLYQPEHTTNTPLIVWLHGGGFVGGDLNSNDPILIQWVQQAKCAVLSVDYRLAPEHPYPAALYDALSALNWASETRNPPKIIVAGASAGACIAAGLCLYVRDHSGPAIDHQLLIIPALDDRHITPSSTMIEDPRVWNVNNSRAGWKAYLGKLSGGDIPIYAAPARAEDLSQLPAATLFVEEYDGLKDEALNYVKKLETAGIATDFIFYPKTFHGHFAFVPTAEVSQKTFKDIQIVITDLCG